MTFAAGETVSIITAGPTVDPYSDETVYDDWDNPTSVVVDNVLVGSGGSTEPSEIARNAVDSDYDLIFQPPLTTVPTAQSRIVVRGDVCEVDGKPFVWHWAASGGDAGLVVRCSIKEG